MHSQVSLIKCKSYEQGLVEGAVREAIDLLGGIVGFIKPQSKVLLKPNLLVARSPEDGITTHPAVVRAVIRILKDINCRLYLGDSPSVWGNRPEDVDEVYDQTGMRKLCHEEGVELVKFDKRKWSGEFPLTACLDECDYLISIPKFKTHEYTTLTGAIKNLFGLVTDTYKLELHKRFYDIKDFARMLVDIYAKARPVLSIVDGIVAMEGDGPGSSGKLRQLGVVVASPDAVALDSVLARIMGLRSSDIATTKEAAVRGLGVSEIDKIEIRGERIEDVISRPFILPTASFVYKLPKPLIEQAKKLIRFYPKIKHSVCTRCLICVRICPKKVISLKKKRIVIKYSGCISCFCCQESCPASAIRVKKSLLSRIIGL